MTRPFSLSLTISRFAWSRLIAGVLVSFCGAFSASAQHAGAMGHGAAGPRFSAPPAMHMPAPGARRSQHLSYLPPFRGGRPAPPNFSRSSFSRSHFISPTRFRHRRFLFASNFGFFPPYGFSPFGYGFYPWWGWDWDSGGVNGCNSYDGTCDYGPTQPPSESGDSETPYSASDNSVRRPMIVIYLRDGSGYGALDYWLASGVLHIETTYGEHKSFPLEQVDLERTGKENALRGVSFTFASAPMISDPGPVLAPESYAPACPSTSTNANTSGVPEESADGASSSFGATGSSSAKGFAVASVRADSLAAAAGLQSGDIIVRLDCRSIRNSEDLESAFAASKGTIWVSYLIQGPWLTDKKVAR